MPDNPKIPLFDSPISEKQRDASRANGRKSRGPVTAAGKARSSANAIQHGLHARFGLLAKTILLPGESRARFDDLLTQFQLEFAPATYVENVFVEQMVVAQWRLMRTWNLERAGFCHAAHNPEPDSDDATRDAVSVLTDPTPLRTFNYLEMRYERQFARSLDKLIKIRAIHCAEHENERNEPGECNKTEDLPI
jgi:hypothetical protein